MYVDVGRSRCRPQSMSAAVVTSLVTSAGGRDASFFWGTHKVRDELQLSHFVG